MPIFYPQVTHQIAGNTSGATANIQSGTFVLAGGSNVTLSQNANSVTISAAAGGGAAATVSDAATSGTFGRLAFTNLNGVTLSLSSGAAGSHTIVGSHNALTSQSNQALSGSNGSFAFQTATFGNLNGMSFYSSNGSLVGSYTVPAGGASPNFSAGTTSSALDSVVFSNSGGVSFGLNGSTITATVVTSYQAAGAYLTTAALSNHSHGVSFTSGSVAFQTLSFTNSNGISFNSGTQGIFGSHNAITTAALSNHSHGNPTLNLTNLSGTTASASNGFTLSLSAAAPGGGAAATFSAGTSSAALASIVFSNSNGVSFGLNGSTITASAAAGAGGVINRQYHEIMDGENLVTVAAITGVSYSKRPIFVPFWMDGEGLSVKSVEFYASRPAGTSLNMTYGIGFYTMSNSTRLDLVSSTTNAVSVTTSAQFSGIRRYQFTGLSNMTLSEGRWIAALYFSGSNDSTAVANLALYGGQTMIGVGGYVFPGTNSTGATSGTEHVVPFWGVYASTTAAFPASVARSQISGQGSNNVNADIYMVIREI